MMRQVPSGPGTAIPPAPKQPRAGGPEAPRPGGLREAWIVAWDGIATLWLRDILRFRRDRNRMAGSLGQPLLYLLVLGSGLSPAVGALGGASGLSYVQFLFPGVIVMAVLFTAVFSGVSVVWDREFGFLREVLVAPVPRWAVAVGKIMGATTIALVQGAIVLLLAPFIGVALTVPAVLLTVVLLALSAFTLSALGLFLAAKMKSFEGFQVMMSFLIMPMFFTSGALFPTNQIPSWLWVVTRLNPLTYAVDALRQVLLGPTVPAATVALQLGPWQLTPLMDSVVLLAVAAALVWAAVQAFGQPE